jgi:thiamine biosynthesis lipoprotein
MLMGTHASVEIPNCEDDKVFEAVFARFHEIIQRLSPFKPDSELCQFQRGGLSEDQVSDEMKKIMKACKEAEKLTDGYFSAYFEDKFNPTGYVKGWAIAEAGKVIEKHDYKTYCISVGGDILARSNTGKVWKIGVQDPSDKTKILDKLSISNGAVATSGSYERGGHIINPKTKKPNNELTSITVVGPDIIMADVLSTAGFAMGKKGIDFVNHQNGYKAIAAQ